MPVDTLLSNWAYMVMAAFAWTLKAWFALRLPHTTARYVAEKAAVLRMEFKATSTHPLELWHRAVSDFTRLNAAIRERIDNDTPVRPGDLILANDSVGRRSFDAEGCTAVPPS